MLREGVRSRVADDHWPPEQAGGRVRLGRSGACVVGPSTTCREIDAGGPDGPDAPGRRGPRQRLRRKGKPRGCGREGRVQGRDQGRPRTRRGACGGQACAGASATGGRRRRRAGRPVPRYARGPQGPPPVRRQGRLPRQHGRGEGRDRVARGATARDDHARPRQGTRKPHACELAARGARPCLCLPRHPWQRGTSENANGLIRGLSPKGVGFPGVTGEEVQKAFSLINDRPGRCWGTGRPKRPTSGNCCARIDNPPDIQPRSAGRRPRERRQRAERPCPHHAHQPGHAPPDGVGHPTAASARAIFLAPCWGHPRWARPISRASASPSPAADGAGRGLWLLLRENARSSQALSRVSPSGSSEAVSSLLRVISVPVAKPLREVALDGELPDRLECVVVPLPRDLPRPLPPRGPAGPSRTRLRSSRRAGHAIRTLATSRCCVRWPPGRASYPPWPP